MIQITNQNYKNIYDILSQNIDMNIDNKDIQEKENDDITLIDTLPNTISDDNMKNELSNYLREQLNN